MKKKILIIRHSGVEGPGTFGDLLKKKKIGYVILDVFKDNGARLRAIDLNAIAGVVILGGPMNVYEEKKYPFLKEEKKFIRKTVKRDIPLIGICLGAQLIACAFGAKVRRGPCEEIGWYDISLKPAAKKDPLLKGLKKKISVFQWHGDTFDLPARSTLLAEGNAMNQAFRLKENAWGFQFHLEVDWPMIDSWYKDYMVESRSEASWSRMKERYARIRKDFKSATQAVFEGFLALRFR
jgi:GMP synthase-like glutamine amidotransferase